MERVELLNALRLVRDYCESNDCDSCDIVKECNYCFRVNPCGWEDLDDDV